MSAFSQPKGVASFAAPALKPMMRRPQRISASLNWALHQRLQERADLEGRSLSNLVAHLLERSI
jgi:hypothetical protein